MPIYIYRIYSVIEICFCFVCDIQTGVMKLNQRTQSPETKKHVQPGSAPDEAPQPSLILESLLCAPPPRVEGASHARLGSAAHTSRLVVQVVFLVDWVLKP